MAIEELAEEVASNLEEAAEATRRLNAAGLGYLALGLGVGAAIGFYFGHKFNREKIKAEAFKESEEEIAQLREVYQQKTIALTNTDKPAVEEMVQGLGYAVQIPEREQVPVQRPLKPPVPLPLEDLPENPVGTSKSKNSGWSYEEELTTRSPTEPYVIHQDEYDNSQPDYSKVEYTYFTQDDVIVDNEDNQPILHAHLVVGLDNLRFGHGSDDAEIVHVRSDRLNSDMRIERVDRSYEEEVVGLANDDNDT